MLKTLIEKADAIPMRPSQRHYRSVQIDEVLGYMCGSRSAKTVQELIKKLAEVEIDEYRPDHWKSFNQVLPAQKQTIGKAYIKNIEDANICLIARNKRFVHKTTCFSKKKENHKASINIMFNYRNRDCKINCVKDTKGGNNFKDTVYL
ncbi:MAG: insertion element iso-iS1n protein insB [Adhaeribacter sp.]|nr:insertion element iso-iS1n protein insB [Adhaeribacter sp.]